jgi:hypothetical protein
VTHGTASGLRLVLTSPGLAVRGHPSCAANVVAQSIIETSRERRTGGVVVRADHGHELEPSTVRETPMRMRIGRAPCRAVPDAHLGAPAARPRRRQAGRPAGMQGVRDEDGCGVPLDIGRMRARRRPAWQLAGSGGERIAGPYVREVALIWSRTRRRAGATPTSRALHGGFAPRAVLGKSGSEL